jgi:hypothetical protein
MPAFAWITTAQQHLAFDLAAHEDPYTCPWRITKYA